LNTIDLFWNLKVPLFVNKFILCILVTWDRNYNGPLDPIVSPKMYVFLPHIF